MGGQFNRFFHICCSKKQVEHKAVAANVYYDKAFELRDAGDIDSSFLYFHKAKDEFLSKKDTFSAGKCLVNLAYFQEKKGDYFGSIETALPAIHYFNTKDSLHHHYLSINYNTLSIASSKLKNYNRSLGFLEKAILFSEGDTELNGKNNLAINYKNQKKYSEAIIILENLIQNNNLEGSMKARIIDNLSYIKWLENNNFNPVSTMHEAVKLRKEESDLWGLNASYSHLSQYYTLKQPDSALVYAEKMLQVAKEIKSPSDQIEALEMLISLEDSENSKRYFKDFQKLNDSLQNARSIAKNQFALIRYETDKNKLEFLKAKADSTEKQNHIITQYFGLAFLILFLILSYVWFNKRQKLLKTEKVIEVKNTELKFSKKVHDRVANKIYQIMSQVENTEQIDKDALLFGLENAYEISRDISYDSQEIIETQNFYEQLSGMLNSYSSDSVMLILNGNNENLWEEINFQTKTEVYLILQEVMTNMKKHSKADRVVIKFERLQDHINIMYADNGIGISGFSPKNGILNMEIRINSIGGTINFDTENSHLSKIKISFPVKN